MPFDAGSIAGSLKFDMSEFTHGMIEAEGVSKLFPAIAIEFLENPLIAVIGVAKEAAHALLEMFGEVTKSQADIARTAEAMGVSASFLDGWGKAAEVAGGHAEEFRDSVKFLARSAAEANEGNEQFANVFKSMGLAVADASGHLKPMEQLTREMADAMARLPSGAERTRVSMQLLGRASLPLINFFAQGSAAADDYAASLEKMGAVLSEEAAESAVKFAKLQVEVNHAWEGIKEQLAEPIRDALMPYLEALLQWVQTHPEQIKAFVEEMSKEIVKTIKILGEIVEWIIENFETLEVVLGTAGLGAAALLAVSAFKLIGSAAVKLTAELEGATFAQLAFNAASRAGATGLAGAGISAAMGGGTGQNIGAGVGSAVGGPIGQALIPIPVLGYLIGSAVGGLAGGGIGSTFDSDKPKTEVKIGGINVTTHGETREQVAKDTAFEVHKAIKQHAQKSHVQHAIHGKQ